MANLAAIMSIGMEISDISRGISSIDSKMSGLETIAKRTGTVLAGAFTATAIVAAGQKVLDFAGNLTDLSQRTGISTTGLQRLQIAMEGSSVSIEDVTKATEKLAKGILGGDKSAVTALDKLGLSVGALKQMNPEQQFLTVADAIGKIPNATEKSYAAMSIFGKGGATLLQGLTGNLSATVAEAEKMGLVIGEDVIRDADAFGDALGLMGKQLMAITASAIGPLLPALSTLGNVLMWVANTVIGPVLNVAIKGLVTGLGLVWSSIATLLAKLADLAQQIPLVGKHLGGLTTASDWLTKSAASTMESVEGLWKETEKTGTVATQATAPLMGFGEAIEKADKAARKLDESLERIRVTQFQLSRGAVTASQNVGGFAIRTGEFVTVGRDFSNILIEGQSKVNEFGSTITTHTVPSLGAMGQGIIDLGPKVNALADSLSNLPSLLVKSFTGGGGLKGAINAFGAQLGGGLFGEKGALSGVVKSATGGLSKMFGSTIGGALGAAIPGIGAMIGPGIEALMGGVSKLFGKLFGTAGRDAVRSFAAGMGGFDALHGKLNELGPIGETLWIKLTQGTGRNNAEQAKANIAEVTQALDAHAQKVQDTTQQWREAADAQRALADRMQDVLTLTPDVEAGFARAYDATTPQDFLAALNDINASLDLQAKAHKDVSEAAAKYGLTIEKMGPAWQQQELNTKAQDLFRDYNLLTTSGANHIAVLEGMAKSVDDYVDNARKFGTEVPASMKPMLQSFIDQGLLTDDQGQKIKDLETLGVKFGDTVELAMGRVATSMEKLVDILERQLKPAIANVPDGDFTIRGRVEFPDKGLPSGYHPDVDGPYPMADGGSGTVNRPTLFMAGEKGPEQFAFSGANRSFGSGGDSKAVVKELAALRAEQAKDRRDLPKHIALAMRDLLALHVRS